MKFYLVGGAVRDFLLGLESKDRDYVVTESSEKEMLSLGFMKVGNGNFQVFLHPKTKAEYALARTETKTGLGYSGFETNTKNVTLEDDLSRRDLTINSMAMANGELIDPFNGLVDIHNKILRHTTEAFRDDPLRVLRVARFMARYGPEWSVHPSTLKLMNDIKQSGELDHLTPERVWKETEKALLEDYPELYFQTLEGFGIFPEIDCMRNIPQPKEHHPEGCVFTHTMLVLKRAVELDLSIDARFAALCHDFGKPICHLENGNLHGHEERGVEIINAFCDRLKVPNKFRKLAVLSSKHHTRCHKIFNMRPKKVRDFLVNDLKVLNGVDDAINFLYVCRCDAQGRGEESKNEPYNQMQFICEIAASLIAIDRQAIAKDSMSRGRFGKLIGDDIRMEEIKVVSSYISEYS